MLYSQYFIDDLKNRAEIVGMAAVVMLLLASAIAVMGQEKPKAVFILEFSHATCDDMITYIDLLARPLAENPNSKGLAIFYPEVGHPREALSYEEFLRFSAGFVRRFGGNNPEIIHGRPSKTTRVEFWIVPPGAEEPQYDVAKPGEIFADVKKPVLYNTEFGGEMCPAASPTLMADLIKFNPNVNLRIVIRGKTARYRNRKTSMWLYRLVTREKIARQRIQVILSRKLANYYPYEDVEFWIAPVRKH